MEFHTPRSLMNTHGIDVFAGRCRAKSRPAYRSPALLRRMTDTVNGVARWAIANLAAQPLRHGQKSLGAWISALAAARLEFPRRARRSFTGRRVMVRKCRYGTSGSGVGAAEVFVITKDDVPYHATFSKHEATLIFDSIVETGAFRQASVVAISTIQEYRRVLFDAGQAA